MKQIIRSFIEKLQPVVWLFKKILLLIFIIKATVPVAFSMEFSNDPFWRRLLYYKKTITGGVESLVDSEDFFFHSEGKTDPKLELQASIAAFKNNKFRSKKFKFTSQCAFPARYQWLKSKLPKGTFKDQSCKDLEKWRKGLSPAGISLVFSTAYSNNPASMFGHTFFRIKNGKRKNPLLDYALAYSAYVPPEDGVLKYSLKGLLGFYKGQFSLEPYYQKIKEYNDQENRDLYEYDLNLSQKDIKILMDHYWELYINSYFDYYFLAENCSYLLGAFLNVVKPQWNLDRGYKWYVLPTKLTKKVNEHKNAIIKKEYRPSLKKKFEKRLNLLSSVEYQEFKNTITGSEKYSKNSKVLDAAIAYFNFKKLQANAKISRKMDKIFKQVLIARSRLKEKPVQFTSFSQRNDPTLAVGASRISVGGGKFHGLEAFHLDYKSTFHDLMGPELGFEPFSSFNFIDFSLLFDKVQNKLIVERAELINFVSTHDFSVYDDQPSWEISLGVQEREELYNYQQYFYYAQGGFGLAKYFFDQRAMIMGTLGLRASYGTRLKNSHDGEGYANLKVALSPDYDWKIKFEVKSYLSYQASVKKYRKTNYDVRIRKNLSKNSEIQLVNRYIAKPGKWGKNSSKHHLEVAYFY